MQHVAVAVEGVDVAQQQRVIRQGRSPWCGDAATTSARVPSTTTSPKCSTVMRSANSSATSMSCSIITMVTSRGIAGKQAQHVAPLVDRQAGERLVEQQHLRVLRQRHGDLDAAALAVGGVRERPIGQMVQPDPRERRPAWLDQRRPVGRNGGRDSSAAARGRAATASRCATTFRREQRDDLVGAGEAEMRAPAAGDADEVAAEQRMRAASGRNSPVIRLNSVVLPAPFGPMISRRSPGSTARFTSG